MRGEVRPKKKEVSAWKAGGPVFIKAANSWFYFDEKGLDIVCAGVIGRISWKQVEKAKRMLKGEPK